MLKENERHPSKKKAAYSKSKRESSDAIVDSNTK
jgi:hypothetical protein